jgi:NCAIR mutase (PurE)-related protein
LGLGLGLGVVAVVDVVDEAGVVAAVVAAALVLCVDVDDADPHALTISVSRTAASGMRSCLMVVKDAGMDGLLPGRRRRSRRRENPHDLNRR